MFCILLLHSSAQFHSLLGWSYCHWHEQHSCKIIFSSLEACNNLLWWSIRVKEINSTVEHKSGIKKYTYRLQFYIDNMAKHIYCLGSRQWQRDFILIFSELPALAGNPWCNVVCTNCFEKRTHFFEHVKNECTKATEKNFKQEQLWLCSRHVLN